MPETIAIFLPNWIGDVVMATPTLRAVRDRFPETHLIGVMRPYVDSCLEGTHWLDEKLLYSRDGDPRFSRRRLVRTLRQRQVDRALLLPGSLSTALLAWLGGARQRVGFARSGRSLLLTDRIAMPRQGGKRIPNSAVDHYLEVARRIGCDTTNRQLELPVTSAEQQAAASIWSKLGLNDAQHVVTLNAGGAYGSAKRWPKHRCLDAARAIVERFDAKVLILCGPAEQAEAAEVVSIINDPRVVSLADEQVSVGLSKACIARSDCLITTDSGPRHLAAAVGCPTVSLFGPTDPRWADNYNPHDTILSIAMPCAPCAARSCPLGHNACMRDITPEHLIAALRPMLAGARVAA